MSYRSRMEVMYLRWSRLASAYKVPNIRPKGPRTASKYAYHVGCVSHVAFSPDANPYNGQNEYHGCSECKRGFSPSNPATRFQPKREE